MLTHRPDPRLAPFVKMYFWGKDDEAPLAQRIVPNGEMGLCFYRGNAVRYDGTGQRKNCIAGQRTRYQDIISDGKIEIVGVHFTTLGAHAFIRMPLNELFNQTIGIDDVEDTELNELGREIEYAESAEECWMLMDRFLIRRLGQKGPDIDNTRRLQRAIAYGQMHRQDAAVGDIANEACLSPRHFNRIFSETVGMPPKEYLRLQRYHHALNELKHKGDEVTMSEIAWENGYCDFSHMSADMKKISGYSPTELLKASANDNDNVGWRI